MSIKYTAALAMALGSLFLTSLAHAAGMRTYTNTAHGYRMRYPAQWRLYPHTQGTDVEFQAPDRDALVSATVAKVRISVAQIKALNASTLKGLGKPQGSIRYKVVTIHAISYEFAEVVTKTVDGRVLDVAILGTEHAGYLYSFAAFLLATAPAYKAETTTVRQILNSITMTR